MCRVDLARPMIRNKRMTLHRSHKWHRCGANGVLSRYQLRPREGYRGGTLGVTIPRDTDRSDSIMSRATPLIPTLSPFIESPSVEVGCAIRWGRGNGMRLRATPVTPTPTPRSLNVVVLPLGTWYCDRTRERQRDEVECNAANFYSLPPLTERRPSVRDTVRGRER